MKEFSFTFSAKVEGSQAASWKTQLFLSIQIAQTEAN